MGIVYLNGQYIEAVDAFVSVEDRGFLLGDACYEATAAYHGRFLLLDRHLERLQAGLDAIQIGLDCDALESVHTNLLVHNNLQTVDFGMVYVQVTRGVAPRSHAFPSTAVTPTIYAFAKPLVRATPDEFERGSAAIVAPDLRWQMPRIKSTNLLPNILAQQQAVESSAVDVVMHRDGVVTEGTHNNIFIVEGGTLVTAPADDLILRGITRDLVLDLASEAGISASEETVSLERLKRADEVFFTGTTTEIRPTVLVDGSPIGGGRVGPLTRKMNELFSDYVKRSK